MIYVDLNESSQARDVMEELAKLGKNPIVKQLKIGDYMIVSDSLYLIERKTIPDFINSVNGGRLIIQLRDFSKYGYEKNLILLLEGNLSYAKYRRFSAKRLMSIIHSLARKYMVIYTPDAYHTAAYIDWLSSKTKREVNQDVVAEFFRRTASPKMTLRDKVRYVVQGFVGTITAKRLLEKFGTVKAIVTASEEELMQVDGIGKKTAKKLFEIFNYDVRRQDNNNNGFEAGERLGDAVSG